MRGKKHIPAEVTLETSGKVRKTELATEPAAFRWQPEGRKPRLKGNIPNLLNPSIRHKEN